MPQPPFIRALLSSTTWPTPSRAMPSPPLLSASLPTSCTPRPWIVALSSTAMPSPPFSSAMLCRTSVPGESTPTSMPLPSPPLALLSSIVVSSDSSTTIPPWLPRTSLARISALDQIALDDGVVGGQQLLADHDARSEVVRHGVLDDRVVAAADHRDRRC